MVDELIRTVDVGQRLLQVDDVDAVALGQDVALHLGVPTTGLVPEVHATVKQRLHGDDGHSRNRTSSLSCARLGIRSDKQSVCRRRPVAGSPSAVPVPGPAGESTVETAERRSSPVAEHHRRCEKTGNVHCTRSQPATTRTAEKSLLRHANTLLTGNGRPGEWSQPVELSIDFADAHRLPPDPATLDCMTVITTKRSHFAVRLTMLALLTLCFPTTCANSPPIDSAPVSRATA
jgi:hypothetical protein